MLILPSAHTLRLFHHLIPTSLPLPTHYSLPMSNFYCLLPVVDRPFCFCCLCSLLPLSRPSFLLISPACLPSITSVLPLCPSAILFSPSTISMIINKSCIFFFAVTLSCSAKHIRISKLCLYSITYVTLIPSFSSSAKYKSKHGFFSFLPQVPTTRP